MRYLFITGFLVFVFDQITKWFVLHELNLEVQRQIDVFPPYLTFRMAWNKGINFGLGANFDARLWLIGLSVLISVAVFIWLWRSGGSKWTYIAGGFLVGGAMANVLDRLIYGAVADFLNVSCCGIENPYAFNFADVAIFIGAIGLAFLPDTTPKPQRPKFEK